MSRYERLRHASQTIADFDLTDSSRDLCAEADSLQAWSDDVCRAALAHGEIIALKQAKLRLAERYFARRLFVQRRHRGLSGQANHVCLYAVFVAAFERLEEAEHDIRPPVLEVTRTIVSNAPRARYDGLMIGEISDEEFE